MSVISGNDEKRSGGATIGSGCGWRTFTRQEIGWTPLRPYATRLPVQGSISPELGNGAS
jgi:hypothetical protein